MQSVKLNNMPRAQEHILELFHEFQAGDSEHSHISPASVRQIAEHLDLSMADVYGVLSFYHMFSHRPRGKYVIRLCDSLSCRIVGSLDIYSYLTEKLGLMRNRVSKDGLFSLELVNCLGSCDSAPNMMVNDQLISNLTVDKVDSYITSLREEAAHEKE